MGFFEKYLTLWVTVCILVGVSTGYLLPGLFQFIGRIKISNINLPVAVLVWLMIIPMLIKIDLRALKKVKKYARGIGVTLFINWAIKPFSMALLAWFFIGHLFKPFLPQEQVESYIAGLIILAAAPCTAMVFVWSHLTEGEPLFTLTQVALNDVIMVILFAPIVGLLLGLSSITVPWDTLFLSVIIYIVIPLMIANTWRNIVLAEENGTEKLKTLIQKIQPFSLSALLLTLVLLFGFQGIQIIKSPVIIFLLAIPILVQVIFNSGLAYLLNRLAGSPHCVAGPSALIGASNFFELAVAVSISLFGLNSGATLVTVVGVLVEVPVMLTLVKISNHTKKFFNKEVLEEFGIDS